MTNRLSLRKTKLVGPWVAVVLGLTPLGCGSGDLEGEDSPGNDGAGDDGSDGDGSGGSGHGGGGSVSSRVCEEPQPEVLPATKQIVGTGTAESCTAEALREAVTLGGHVEFDCGAAPHTIAVTTPIEVRGSTVLDGGDLVTLDGGGASQILIAATNSFLSVRNLRFVRGKAPSTMEAEGIGGAVAGQWRSRVEVIGCTFEENVASRGGGAVAVWTGSSLTVVSSRFERNHSWYGGAIYSLLSPLRVYNSDFVDNSNLTDGELGDGGAIGTDGASEDPDDGEGGVVEICGSYFGGNLGYGQGGAAYIWVYPPDEVLVDRTTVESNTIEKNARDAAIGGGMRISNGAITIRRSSFLSNKALANGGALYLDCAPTCDIVNSTFFGNESETYGGAIFGDGARLNNVTFAENRAGGHGGALFGEFSEIRNSLFVDNETGNPWGQAKNCSSTNPGEHVLQWSSESGDAGGDSCVEGVVAADPKLSPPGDHGGSTPTLLPAEDSGALDLGVDCETDDQRGQPRTTSSCDLGAVEL